MKGASTCVSREENTVIDIECPYCGGKKHPYNLIIKRTDIFFCDSKEFNPVYHPMAETSYTRVFVCPDTGKEFKSEITLLSSKERLVDDIQVQ